jgi:MFS family permease
MNGTAMNETFMNDEPVSSPTVSPSRAALSAGAMFFINGAVFSNWLPRVPEVRDRLGVDNAGLGAALAGGGLGGLIGSFLVAKALHRFGSRRLLLTAATLLAFLLPCIAIVPAPAVLFALLIATGLLDVFNDMSMNTQGVMAQQRLGKSIMQRLHGMWSLGFFAGTSIGSLAARAGVSIGWHLGVVSAVLLVGVAMVRPSLTHIDPSSAEAGETATRVKFFSPLTIAMSLMAIAVAWIEAVPNEWSAVVMRDLFDAGKSAGAGTVAFAIAMTVGRLSGDKIIELVGPKRLLTGGLVLSALGAMIVVLAQHRPVALAGFAVWGLGVAPMFPQLYGMAGNLPGKASAAALGAMGVGQRFGFMVSGPFAGLIARTASLRWTVGLTALATVLVVTVTRPRVDAAASAVA